MGWDYLVAERYRRVVDDAFSGFFGSVGKNIDFDILGFLNSIRSSRRKIGFAIAAGLVVLVFSIILSSSFFELPLSVQGLIYLLAAALAGGVLVTFIELLVYSVVPLWIGGPIRLVIGF